MLMHHRLAILAQMTPGKENRKIIDYASHCLTNAEVAIHKSKKKPWELFLVSNTFRYIYTDTNLH